MKEIPVAKVLVRNDKDEFLVVKERESGKWELPGGIIEDDEDRFEAAEREVLEETGLEVSGLEDVVRIELEDDRVIDCYMVHARDHEGNIEAGGDVEEAKWVEAEEFREMEWHVNSAYNIVPMEYLDNYLETEKNYGKGDEIDVVKVLVQNGDHEFLAVRKTTEDKIHSGQKYALYGRMAGKWELPGGKFKDSGDRFEAAKREVKEECGIEIKNIEDVVREEIEEVNSVNTYIVSTTDWDGEVELSREHQDYRWVTPEEYLRLNWHQDAGYGFPPMKFLEEYLN
ncbi:MAG: NUDIX domain-containing protein [Candidatus Nanohaloarchaea archaeon]